LGVFALIDIRKSEGRLGGKGMARGGIATGCLGFLVLITGLFRIPEAVLTHLVSGGPSKGDVSGTVTLDGEPLASGMIAFIAGNHTVATYLTEGGKYTVDGVPAGVVKVTVETKSMRQLIDDFRKAELSGKGGRKATSEELEAMGW